MRILLDSRTLPAGHLNAEKRHFVLTCARILSDEKGVEWLFLVDKRHPDTLPADLGLRVPVSGEIRGWIGRRSWVGWQLPRIVKKYHPDLVMTTDEMALAPGAPDEQYAPLSVEGKEEVKRSYAGEKEYFLAGTGGTKEETVNLLKAFSLFKKRQRSNMQLVLAGEVPVRGKQGAKGRRAGKGVDLDRLLSTYKYRSDVHLHGSPGEPAWRKLVAAAYALILPTMATAKERARDNQGLRILNAWRAESPVISIDSASPRETGGDAVLYAQPGDPASLAGLLMSLYTNEDLRAELIGKGRRRVRSYSWERSAGQLWEAILRAANQQ